MSKKTDIRRLALSVKTINPSVARTLLATFANGNRVVMKQRVDKLAEYMKQDTWVLGEPIMLDKEGKLLNGQHRLKAVIQANKPVDFVVVTGYDRLSTFGHIDDVSARSLKSWLEIRGEEHCGILAPVVNMAIRYKSGLIPTASMSSRLTIDGAMSFLDANPKIRDAVAKAPGTNNRLAPKAMQVFLYWAFRAKDKAVADRFFIDLVTYPDEIGDPMYTLRTRLQNDKKASKKMKNAEKMALFIKAWNAVRNERQTKTLLWQAGREVFPAIV